MFEIFQKYLTDKLQLTPEELQLIASVSVIKNVRKRQYLLQQGDVWKFNAFVCAGFLHTYAIDDKGIKHILNFSPENYWTGDRESLATGEPSKFNIEAIEDSEVLLIEKEPFEMLCRSIPAFNDLVNAVLQKSFVVSQSRIHATISFSAEEKYADFIKKYPSIANRIPQHMIASYIGITPETLTRIRRNAAKK